MSDIGRNAPCPCGSGRKYKQCCLRRDQLWRRAVADDRDAIRQAIAWLRDRHEDALKTALGDFFGALGSEEQANLAEVNDDVAQMIDINAREWLLAEAMVEVVEASGETWSLKLGDLALGSEGPPLNPEQRSYLESIATNPLCPYEVTGVEREVGIRVRDALIPDQPSIWVRDTSLSRTLERGDLIALRLVNRHGAQVPSGCVYHYPPPLSSEVLEEIRAFRRDSDAGPEGASAGRSVSAILRDRWLLALTRTRRMPQIVDARTKEPILLCEDHFQVLDWPRLERVLEQQSDADGDRKHGWSRIEHDEGKGSRPRWSMRVGPRADTFIGFGRTRRAADDGRAWLEGLAGDAVRFLARDIVDPMSPAALHAPRPANSKDPFKDLPRDERMAAFQQIHEHVYRNWADEPIPALGDMTPRQAVRTPEGRERVARLLKDYEVGEARRARGENRGPTDFGFLWASVGLEPDASLVESRT